MTKTGIQWTDYSSNPLRYRRADGAVVWACVHASPGCQHCYSEASAARFDRGAKFTVPEMALRADHRIAVLSVPDAVPASRPGDGWPRATNGRLRQSVHHLRLWPRG